jgi:prophage regulatory protein
MGAILIRLNEVKLRTGMSRSGIYQQIADGKFPKQVKLGAGARSAGWVCSEVDEWVNEQIASRDLGAE